MSMEEALRNLLNHYLQLASSGDAGNWDPEEEDVVKDARMMLEKVTYSYELSPEQSALLQANSADGGWPV